MHRATCNPHPALVGSTTKTRRREHRQPTFGLALAGGLLLWAAFPPLGWWPLAWVAPVPWIFLLRYPELPGRRPYRALWLAGLIHWAILLEWVRRPHWSAGFGWIALSLYLACYLPLFVALARATTSRLRLPLIIAAPLVWTGLELFRCYFLTGFGLALVGHTQLPWTSIIQISDLGGAYAVSFVVLFVAACLAQTLPGQGCGWRWWPWLPLSAVLLGCLIYGHQRMQASDRAAVDEPGATVAMIQGAIDVSFEVDNSADALDRYLDLSLQAISARPDLDLIAWPESMFASPATWVTHAESRTLTPEEIAIEDSHVAAFQRRLDVLLEIHRAQLARLPQPSGMAPLPEKQLPHFVLCCGTLHFGKSDMQRYNTALLVDDQAEVVGRYDKMHPVMFGEYVPLGSWLPQLYKLTPMYAGLTPGSEPKVFNVAGVRLAPTICFESTVPHLIGRQVRRLKAQGQEPDALLNLSNDGWFWGTSALDMHLMCNVFRAVEHRKPVIVAANTGFSAWIDRAGRVIERGPRRDEAILIAQLHPGGQESLYTSWGDLLAGICLLVCAAAAIGDVWGRWGRRQADSEK